MGTPVDSLDIQIAAQASKASQSLDALTRRLDRISSSLTRAGGSGMTRLSVGIVGLSTAARRFNGIDTASINNLSNSIKKFSSVDVNSLRSTTKVISEVATSLRTFKGMDVSDETKELSSFFRAISSLGGKSAIQAVENIPKLSVAMKELMANLSTAPRVSQNIIDMTNALAKLARTGASSGRAVNSLTSVFDRFTLSSNRSAKHSTSLASKIGKIYATYWLLFRAFGKLKESMDISSQLTEVENVVANTFVEYKQLIDDFASTSITDLGMSELTTKKIASRFQSMGSAMGIARGEMANMSLDLTKLTADMASFYNVEQDAVAEDLASIFTGETRPLREYGLDLTQATLQEWAMKQGIDAKVSSMSQAEKAMLRYQYVMANTTNAQGDFAATSHTWANQTRMLAQNFQALGSTIGGVLINVFKPIVVWLNKIMTAVISAVETIANALGAIFGWTIEIFPSGSVDDMSSGIDGVADSADNAAGGLGGAADKANEFKKALLGFDEIEKLPDITDSSGSGGGGGGGGGAGGGAGNGGTASLVRVESIFDKYQSQIKTLEQLGEYIRDALIGAMDNIEWEKIYEKASGFGTGLAEFLNGLFAPNKKGKTVLGSVGETIAGSLNTALNFLNSFGTTFNWTNFGKSISDGINSFFRNYKWALAADTFNNLAHGILDTIIVALDRVEWEEIGRDVAEFVSGIDWTGLLKKVGLAIWRAIKGGIEAWSSAFTAAPIETAIITALGLLKFTGLGSFIALKLVTNIKRALESSATATQLMSISNSFGHLLGAALLVAIAQVAVNEITGGPEQLVASIKEKINAAINKEEWEFGIPVLTKFSDKLRNLFGGKEFWSKSDNTETPEIEISVEAVDNTTPGVTSARQSIETLPNETAVNVDANTNPAEKRVNILGNQLEKSGFKVPIKSEATKKQTIKPLEVFFKKNPVEATFTANEKETQKKLNNFKDLELGAEVKTTTTANALQIGINQLAKSVLLSIGAKISTPAGDIQNQMQSKANGFKIKFDATANCTSLIDSISNTDKKINTFANFNSATSELSKEDKTINTTARFTATNEEKLKAAQRVITGVTAYVKNLSKASGFSGLSLVAKITSIFSGLKLMFQKNGGVFRNGSWSPITAFAGGGLPDMGQMFIAREAGPELVGTLGGHTAVMNNDQIVASVSAGVYQAVKAAMSGGNNQNLQVNVVLEGDAQGLFRTVQQENNRIVMATGKPALLT